MLYSSYYWYFQPLYQDILQHEPTIQHVFKSGKDIIKSQKPSEERDKFEKTIKDIERRWDNVRGKVTKRHEQVQRIVPEASVFKKEVTGFDQWLDDAEKQLKSLPQLTGNVEDILYRKRDLQVPVT